MKGESGIRGRKKRHTVNMPENLRSKTGLYYHMAHIKGLHSEFAHKP